MGLFNKLRNEFIDIIEWTDSSNDTIVYRFPRYQSEIKNGAQLTVRESQVAVLVNEGQFADIFQPGRYQLTTQNMPVLSTLRGWKYGFNSPFKVDVYFVNTKEFINIKWGTANPIMMRDPEFGPIRMRAFGSYCFKVNSDPKLFMTKVAGTNGNFTTENITDQLRNFVITKFTDYLAESKIAALDMAANLNEFSEALTKALKDDFTDYGLELTKFLVENISLPEAVEQALDRRTSMGVIGQGNMNNYTQMQFADSMKDAANNPAGGNNMGTGAMGMGMGFAMANQMAQTMQQSFQQPAQQPAQQAPQVPPIPGNVSYYVAVNGQQQGPYNLAQLQQLAQGGQLTAQSLVWTNGMPSWAAAGSVPALSQFFGAMPPPIP